MPVWGRITVVKVSFYSLWFVRYCCLRKRIWRISRRNREIVEFFLVSNVSPELYATDTSSWVAFFAGFQPYTEIALLFVCITACEQRPPSLHRQHTTVLSDMKRTNGPLECEQPMTLFSYVHSRRIQYIQWSLSMAINCSCHSLLTSFAEAR